MNRTKILVISILLCLMFIVPGFRAESPPEASFEGSTIRLKSRQFIPNGGISSTLAISKEGKITTAEVPSEIHVFIQFYELPNETERGELENLGVRRLGYIPDNAWIASVPKSGTSLDKILAHPSVRWIGEVKASDKIDTSIQTGEIGEWAVNGDGTINLSVVFFGDVSISEGRALLEEYGTNIERQGTSNYWSFTVSEDLINSLASEEIVAWIDEALSPPMDGNDGARAAVGVDTVQGAPYNLDGQNIQIGQWETGHPNNTHPDFGARVDYGDTANVRWHATHVAGTVLGDGTLSGGTYRGMATSAEIISYSSAHYLEEYNDAINNHGIDISTTSWGFPGMNGPYTQDCAELDNISGGSMGRPVTIVWLAGNNGHGNYDTTWHPTAAKNIITVGSTDSNTGSISIFSSAGPVDDGRIKPDVMAPGCEFPRNDFNPNNTIWSTTRNDSYRGTCGTSMATPVVSGSAALLYQAYRGSHGNNDPPPSTVKAVFIQTAEDLGNPGPDYWYGYGIIDVVAAVDTIQDDTTNNELIFEKDLSTANRNDTYIVPIPSGTTEFKATLVWTDEPGNPASAIALVNDLDIIAIAPNGSINYPWTLDHTNPGQDATRDREDHLNNIEQIEVEDPEEGTWKVVVNYTHIDTAFQTYSIVFSEEAALEPPDLIVSKIEFSEDYPMVGDTLTINATINNTGMGGEAKNVKVRFIDNGTVIPGGVTIDKIRNGKSRTAQKSWEPSKVGWRTIEVIADYTNEIIEVNESNNNLTNDIFVTDVLPLPGSTKGIVRDKETWETTMEVGTVDNFKITLDWSTGDSLHLILVSPDGSEHKIEDPKGDDGITIHSPASGTWKIKVYGHSVSQDYVSFTVKAVIIKDEDLPEPPGGVNFTNIDLVYISTCDPSEEGVTFVVKGKEAKPGEPTVNLDEETEKFLEYFKTSLVTPNYKQWISLPIGGVDIIEPFEQTEASRVMLQADVDMKHSDPGIQCGVVSDVYSKFGLQGGWWYRTAFIPGSIEVNSSGCEIYIVDSEFEIETEVMQPSEGEFHDYFEDKLWEQHQPTVKDIVNSDSKYDELSEVYEAFALAQWYKTLDRSQVPLGDIIDTENLEGIEADTLFNRDHWASESQQFICYVPGYSGYYIIGGVSFGGLYTDSQGVIDNGTKDIVEEALENSYVKVGDEYYFGGMVESENADLEPRYMWVPNRVHMAEEDIIISLIVKNKGGTDTEEFKVKFYDKFTHASGYTTTLLIGEETVSELLAGTQIELTTSWNSKRLLGNHFLIAEVDSSNSILESNELNNEKTITLEVTSPFPWANITSPEHGLVSTYGDPITFEGRGTDIQDGALSGGSLVWTSNLDGEIGTGNTFTKTDLSHGTHIITLTVTDSDGNPDTTQTGITIEKAYPQATIITPAEGDVFKQGDNIEFKAEVTDAEDGTLTGSNVVWTSSINGQIGTGASFTKKDLSPGTHTITLTATDSDDLQDTKYVNIIVIAPNAIFLHELSDGSTVKTLKYLESGDQILHLQFPKNVEVEFITATLDVKGQSANPGPFSFREEFRNIDYMDSSTTAAWGGDKLTAMLGRLYLDRIQNPDFDNNAEHWEDAWYGIGQVYDGGKCPGNHNYGCWGWKFYRLYTGSWSKMYQEHVDLTDVEKVSFNYLYGTRCYTRVCRHVRFYIDGNRLWQCDTSMRSYCPLDYGTEVTVDTSHYTGEHTLTFQTDIIGPSDWSIYWLDGGTRWMTMGVDNVRTYREVYFDSVAVSKIVYNPSEDILQVKFEASDALNGGSINYYVSADNGVHWESVSKGSVHTFAYPENNLRWKAEIYRGGEKSTPIIHWVKLSTLPLYPTNPNLDVGDDGDSQWSYSGEFKVTKTTPELGDELQEYVDNVCTADPCKVPLKFHSDTSGKLKVSNINIQYLEIDLIPPTIENALVTPNPSYTGDALTVQAKVTDNKEVGSVTAILDDVTKSLTAQSDDFYEVTFTAPQPGDYVVYITATDTAGLSNEVQLPLKVLSRNPDLAVTDITFTPEIPSERETVTLHATISNLGDADANDFNVGVVADGVSTGNNPLSIPKNSEVETTFEWDAVYGTHTLTVKADSTNDIVEYDEDNNEMSIDIGVIDITPPPAPQPFARPPTWDPSRTHEIYWDPVMDDNGISHYEYQLDFGEWHSTGTGTSFTTPEQADGIHRVFIKAVDKPGNIGPAGYVDIYIDTTPPNTPSAREWHTGRNWSAHNTPYYTWNNPGDEGSGVDYYIVALDDNAPTSVYNESYHPDVSTGMHTFKVKAVDALGQAGKWSNAITVYIDTTPPDAPEVSSPTHPDSGEFYYRTIPTFEWTEPDDHSGISSYYYLVDQSNSSISDRMSFWESHETVTIQGTSNVAQENETEGGLPDGTWYFHIRAIDNVGNLGETAHFKFNILTNSPPEVAVIQPNGGEFWSGVEEVIWNATDPDGDNLTYTVLYSTDSITLTEIASGLTDTFYAWDTTSVSDNNYVVKVIADDGRLTGEDISDDYFMIDNTPPEIYVWLDSELEFYSNLEPLPVQYVAEDPMVNGVASNQLTLQWDIDGTIVSDPTDITTWIGTHTLTLLATDLAGNSNSASVQFTAKLTLVGEGQLKITPEVLKVNPGVLTVHINFPEPYNASEILSGICDYAEHDFIAGHNIKFRREDIERALAEQNETLDIHFEVNGTFSYNGQVLIFEGWDDITEIQD